MSDLLSTSQAAETKAVSRQAINAALRRGTLNSKHVGEVRLVVNDKAFAEWQPSPRHKHAGTMSGMSKALREVGP